MNMPNFIANYIGDYDDLVHPLADGMSNTYISNGIVANACQIKIYVCANSAQTPRNPAPARVRIASRVAHVSTETEAQRRG